jgi:hypothetical protein
MSVLSQVNLNIFDNLNNGRQIQDFLRYDGNLDVSISSVCSTPRNPYGTMIPNEDSRLDIYSGNRANGSIPASPSSQQFPGKISMFPLG